MKYLREDDCLDLSTRKGFFLVIDIANRAVSYSDRYLDKSGYLGVSNKELLHFISPLDNKKRPFAKLLHRYLQRPSLLSEHRDQTSEMVRKFRLTMPKKIVNLDKHGLLKLFAQYVRVRGAAIRGLNILRKLDRALINYLEKECGYLTTDDISYLSYSNNKYSEVINEKIKILKAASRYKRDKSARLLDRLAENLYQLYGPITMGWGNEKPRPLGYYRKEILYWSWRNFRKELAKIKNDNQQYSRYKNLAVRKILPRHKALLVLLPLFPLVKDRYRLLSNWANFHFQPVFFYISKKYKISVDDIQRLGIGEIEEMIATGRIPRRAIAARKKLYVYYPIQGRPRVLVGNEAKKFIRYFYQTVKMTGKGRVACPGKARGRAKIILSQDDFPKFKGDILVVVNTTPDFVPLMKRARAIVAEEGGITAHVSIVSRELGIPCVVGIKNATKVLKDGDRVEVDANKGVVRKL